MKGSFNRLLSSKWGWLGLLAVLLLVNILASILYLRLDLTKEKRYTLSKATRNLLTGLDDDLQVDVFLKGEFPSGFRKLANSTAEFLQLLKDRNGSKLHYRFVSPEEKIPGTEALYADTLISMGAVPINLTVQKKAGESTNIIFPVAVARYQGKEMLVNLYPGASSRISQEEINSAEALMEYQFAKAIDKLTNDSKPGIAYSTGNGEPTDSRPFDIMQTLGREYQFGTIDLNREGHIPKEVDVLMIVKPQQGFSESAKFKIDQFVMNGGRLLCFIDNLIAEQDSLAFKSETIAYDRNLNLTDLFFRYGIRINTDLVMDLQCDIIPFVVGGTAENPQYEFLRWNYYPLFAAAPGQPISKNLGYVAGRFVNSIDTIKVDRVQKIPLLVSSPNSRIISTPALISLNENKNEPQHEQFQKNAIPVAMLLEGEFTSLYKNRATRAQLDSLQQHGGQFLPNSSLNKMIIVADGDMVLNDYVREEGQPVPLPMGWNKYTYTEYQRQTDYGRLFIPVANREFLLNCVEYLVNDPAIIETRNKDIVLRLLDAKKVREKKSMWQFINIGLPIILVILAGLAYQQIRKNKFA